MEGAWITPWGHFGPPSPPLGSQTLLLVLETLLRAPVCGSGPQEFRLAGEVPWDSGPPGEIFSSKGTQDTWWHDCHKRGTLIIFMASCLAATSPICCRENARKAESPAAAAGNSNVSANQVNLPPLFVTLQSSGASGLAGPSSTNLMTLSLFCFHHACPPIHGN